MFTAGNIEWTLGRDRAYLATKDEVLDHFACCLDVIKQRVRVDEYFGCAVESDVETDGIVRVTCRSTDGRPYEPYISRGGAVQSINPRSITLQLSTFMGYFMTHLLMLGKVNDLPLYELDMMDMRAKSNAAFLLALFTLALHNLSLMSECVPNKVFSECGVDVNRW